jgi:predicted Fe-Mo cluster-binding NifX family protein
MKIAIPANAPYLEAHVENRLGTAAYLLVIDTEDMSFEAVAGPSPSSGLGSGIQTIAMVMDRGATAILTGFISPHIAATLGKNGIEVIMPVSGRVMDVVETYKKGGFSRISGKPQLSSKPATPSFRSRFQDAFKKSIRQFSGMVPVLIGVVLMVGLFRGFVSREMLLAIFSGNPIQDVFLGAGVGSVLAGNPVNSYVIAETLLNMGVGLYGTTALMLCWVNVGLVQLPAEISALGMRFAICRTIAASCMAMLVAILTVMLMGGRL